MWTRVDDFFFYLSAFLSWQLSLLPFPQYYSYCEFNSVSHSMCIYRTIWTISYLYKARCATCKIFQGNFWERLYQDLLLGCSKNWWKNLPTEQFEQVAVWHKEEAWMLCYGVDLLWLNMGLSLGLKSWGVIQRNNKVHILASNTGSELLSFFLSFWYAIKSYLNYYFDNNIHLCFDKKLFDTESEH